jgi:signal transduction histidine kinase/ligand-binding sensor domain-containing protein
MMKKQAVIKSILWILLIVLLIPSPGLAQELPVRFERISLEDGLSQVTIYCVFQDSRGLMWFGTEDGLNKYDGYTFTVYKRDPEDPNSLSTNSILVIAEDTAGALWIGTDNGGMNRFDYSTEQFTQYRNDPSNPDSLSDDTVTAIYEDFEGILWIGTGGGGLNKFDPTSGGFLHFRHDPADPYSLSSNAVSAILEDKDGRLWISTLGGGLNQLDRTTGLSTHYRQNPNEEFSISSDYVTSLFISTNGKLWVGTNEGVNEFDPTNGNFKHYRPDPSDDNSLSSNQITVVFEDAAGNLWVGTSSGLNELIRNEEDTGYMTKFQRYLNSPQDNRSLSMDTITAIYEDSSGVLWIGTSLGGLNKLDRNIRRFAHYRNNPNNPISLGSDMVWAIYEDLVGSVWIGTSGPEGGLYRLDRENGHFTHYRSDPADPFSLPSTAVIVIYENRAGNLWVGSYEGGLSRFDRETGLFYNYKNDPDDENSLSSNIVWSILEDSTGAFWVGTLGGGLNRFDPESGNFTHIRHQPENPATISSDNILTLYEDSTRTLWIGTTHGLDRFDIQTKEIKHYRNYPGSNSLSSNAVAAILEDSQGNLWIGTDDGLNKYDRLSETFTHYTEKDGLANDAIGCILEDVLGFLWISTVKGLSKFDSTTGHFKNYDNRDGLQSNEFNRGACHKNLQGELYFGGINGFNIFDPEELGDNPHAPPVILTGFQIFNKPVLPGGDSPLQKAIGETEELVLSYLDYVFSFEFAALDYTIPSKNQYAYMLEGFDRDWNYVDSRRRFASYANLPPGTYNFHVIGSNNDGVWNDIGTQLVVTIMPPPWRTWWAYSLYTILGVSIAAAAWRYRVQKMERKHLEITMWAVQSERDRVARLLESRRQLVASLSHDLRTPVATVRAYLESILSNKENMKSHKERFELMSQELERLQVLLDDLFTLSRLEVDRLTLYPSPIDIVQVAQRAVDAISFPAYYQSKVEVTLQSDYDEICILVDEQRLLQVLMNLLHNAVRHTLPGGIVVVNISGHSDTITLSVQDSGEGITPSDLPHIWDRFYRGQSHAGGGSGLGLALVKELTEAMGGTAAVDSTLGEGSCFTISLPVYTDR